MLRRVGVLTGMLAVLGLAACDQAVLAPDETNLKKGVAEPQTDVVVTFRIIAGDQIRESGPGINPGGHELGSCGAGGVWTNPSGNTSSTVPHPHCITLANGDNDVIVTFQLLANYVQPRGGNIQLNLQSCGLIDDEAVACDPPAFVHYALNQHRMSGGGIVYGTGDDDSLWTIDLSQIATSISAIHNAFDGRSVGPFLAIRDGTDGTEDGDFAVAVLTW